MKNLTWIVTCVTGACLTIACGDNAHAVSPDAPGGEPDSSLPAATYAARIRGTLAAPLADSKTAHDGLASGGESRSNAAGDFAHQVGLGTTDLGSTQDEFLALDQWRDATAAQGFYDNADFKAALDALFTVPPSTEIFERHPDWVSWGDMGAGRATNQPYWFVVIEGKLKSADLETNHAAHDAIAAHGEDQAKQAGDIAHLPHLKVGDDTTFFNVDIWDNEAGMVATFTNADFRAAFLSLFDGVPDVRVYRSTDWFQWYQP